MATGAHRAAIDDTPTTIQNAATAAQVGDSYACKGWANVAVQISGTYTTASTTFQITEDGTNWVSTEGVNTATGVSSPTATANGIYLVNCAGAEQFRANLTTIVGTSQTVVVRGTPFDGSVAGLGAAGETVTANQGTPGATAWPVDTELPAAAALGDATATPTVPGVGSFGLIWNGTTWDRATGTAAGGAKVQGAAASGAAKAGNPVQNGGVFNTTQPTVTTGQAVEAQYTARGTALVTPGVEGFPVTAASLPLPAGASTAAKQPALGVVGTPSADIITTQPPLPLAANVLAATVGGTATAAAADIITVPAGRVWVGFIGVSASCSTVAGTATAAKALGRITVLGTNATPAAGSIFFDVEADAGANAATGTVGDGCANALSMPFVLIAPVGNTVKLQATITITGTAGSVGCYAFGMLQ